MKLKSETSNCALIEVEGGHTHTMISATTEKENKPFNEVHIRYSDFPEDHQGIHIDTFDNGNIYISIPKNVDIQVRLNKKGE